MAFDLETHELAFETLEYRNNTCIIERNGSCTLNSINDGVVTIAAGSSSNLENFALDIEHGNGSWSPLNEHTLATTVYLRPTRFDIYQLSRFPFLDNFTKTTGFITSFKCGTKERRILISTESSNADSLRYLPYVDH